jgi:AAA15 family ATPase/GTPase
MIDYQTRVKKFSIRNYRAFESLDIEFEGVSIAVLAGRNAVGKTSILEALNLAFSDRSPRFTDVQESDFHNEKTIELIVEFKDPFFFEIPYPSGGHYGLIPCWSFTKTIDRRKIKERGKFFSSEYDVKFEPKVQDYNPTEGDFNELKEKIKESKPSALHHLVREFVVSEDGECKYRKQSDLVNAYCDLSDRDGVRFDKNSFKYNQFPKVLFPQVFYFDNNRGRELLPQYNTAFSNVVTELNWQFKREFLKDTNATKKNELLEAYEKVHEKINGINNQQEKLVAPALKILKDELSVDLNQRLQMLAFNIYQPFSSATFGFISPQNQGISATNLGSGISTLLALCLAISFSEQTKAPIIVLVDEPELHLHADLQKNLFNFLKKKEFQAIVSTHSHLLLDKLDIANNFVLECKEDNLVSISRTNGIELADLQFRLLGNSLSDLYVPEQVLIVEGKHDRKILQKCLSFVGHDATQIIDAGGKDKIPNKSDRYKEVLDEILRRDTWYAKAIIQRLKVLVDGDVSAGIISGWATTYGLNTAVQVKHLDPPNRHCLEHFYPESLVKKCIDNVKLRDGSILRDKTIDEIVNIIFVDDKEIKEENYQQIGNRVSKARFNGYVVTNITSEILNSPEGAKLKEIIDWIIS